MSNKQLAYYGLFFFGALIVVAIAVIYQQPLPNTTSASTFELPAMSDILLGN